MVSVTCNEFIKDITINITNPTYKLLESDAVQQAQCEWNYSEITTSTCSTIEISIELEEYAPPSSDFVDEYKLWLYSFYNICEE